MLEIILGNLCSIGAMVCDSVCSTRKTAKGILLVQCVSQVFYGLSAFILKGYSALVQNIVALFRNIAAIKDIKSKPLEICLVIIPVVLGLFFNNRGLIGILPVLANLEYSIAVFWTGGDEKKLKLAFFINVIMFMAFNFAILNFVGGCANIFVVATMIIAFIRQRLAGKTQ